MKECKIYCELCSRVEFIVNAVNLRKEDPEELVLPPAAKKYRYKVCACRGRDKTAIEDFGKFMLTEDNGLFEAASHCCENDEVREQREVKRISEKGW